MVLEEAGYLPGCFLFGRCVRGGSFKHAAQLMSWLDVVEFIAAASEHALDKPQSVVAQIDSVSPRLQQRPSS
jgi:hypothetical protein